MHTIYIYNSFKGNIIKAFFGGCIYKQLILFHA